MGYSCCGRWPFFLPEGHPFEPACKAHDVAYDYIDWSIGTAHIDASFLDRMLMIAETGNFDSTYRAHLERRAWIYYRFARAYGVARQWLHKILN